MNCVVFFVEGAHDVAFLGKIIKLKGYENLSKRKKFDEFPAPINQILIAEIKSHPFVPDIFDLPPKLPFIYNKNSTYILLYSVKGDSQACSISKIKDAFTTALENQEYIDDSKGQIIDVKYGLFFDADDEGVEERLANVNAMFSTVFDNVREITYVFADEYGKGELEDIYLSLIKESEKTNITAIESYLDVNNITCKKHKKALINIAGQKYYSGFSNSVIIGDDKEKLVTRSVMLASEKTKPICEFIDSFLK